MLVSVGGESHYILSAGSQSKGVEFRYRSLGSTKQEVKCPKAVYNFYLVVNDVNVLKNKTTGSTKVLVE